MKTKKELEFIRKQEQELIIDIKRGNHKSFNILYKRYKSFISYKIYQKSNGDKELTKDLTMEVFMKLYSKIGNYREQDFSFLTWATKVTNNHIIDHFKSSEERKKKNNISISGTDKGNDGDEQVIEIKSSDNVSQLDSVILKERKEMVRKFVDKLDNSSKDIIKLRFYNELSYDEIANILNKNVSTVKVMIFRAKEKLKKMLDCSELQKREEIFEYV